MAKLRHFFANRFWKIIFYHKYFWPKIDAVKSPKLWIHFVVALQDTMASSNFFLIIYTFIFCWLFSSFWICSVSHVWSLHWGLSWSWFYGSWIYNYLCNQYLSPLKLWVESCSWRSVLDTTLSDKVCQWQVGGFLRVLWFPPPIKLTTMI